MVNLMQLLSDLMAKKEERRGGKKKNRGRRKI
jgi:hypothetical protein